MLARLWVEGECPVFTVLLLMSYAWTFGPPIGMKITSSGEPLRSNWRGTAKTGPTLDQLRPMTSLVWDACLNQSVSRLHPVGWFGST
jgi:hypothetical protein